jgi:hypothetical protein
MPSEDFLHHTRHATIGMYYERKKMLNDMLSMAEALESKWRPNFLKSLTITRAIRRQMTSIKRMDEHLERLMRATLKEGRKNK